MLFLWRKIEVRRKERGGEGWVAENYEHAEKDYQTGMKYKEIALKYGVSINTVKSWKTRKWGNRDGTHTKPKRVHTKKKETKSPVKKKGYRSNPKNQFTERNDVNVKHGFYRQWLPQEMVQIIEATQDFTLADRLWFQIETKFAALIHLHQLMFVETPNDTLREMNAAGEMVSYKVVYAFEQYEAYIRTEARLTSEWRNVVKQFLELSDAQDERRMKLEQMQLNVTKTQAEIEKLHADLSKEDHQAIEIVIKRKDDA